MIERTPRGRDRKLRAKHQRAPFSTRTADPKCPTGKIRYSQELDVMIALARCQTDTNGHNRHERRHYRCPECHGYHLTSSGNSSWANHPTLDDSPHG